MSLLKRIIDLKEQVEKLTKARSGVIEAKLLETRLAEITDSSDTLQTYVERLKVFRKENIGLSTVPVSIKEANLRLSNVQERFEKDFKAESLTKGKDWKELQLTVREAARAIKIDLQRSWEQFIENAYSGEKPEHMKSILAQTETNKSTFARYRDAHQELNNLAGHAPNTREDFESIRKLSAKLSSIHKSFDFDVPAEVKVFLDAIGSGGASLDLYTDKVRIWLLENRTDSHYRIVAARRY